MQLSNAAYILALIIVIGCLGLLDYRYKLAYWADRRATLLSITLGVAIFVVWDLFGIGLDIFSHGGSPYMLPIRLAPDFPIEEIFFLVLLCYQALLLFRFVGTLPGGNRGNQ